jgi:hypothetical protein
MQLNTKIEDPSQVFLQQEFENDCASMILLLHTFLSYSLIISAIALLLSKVNKK